LIKTDKPERSTRHWSRWSHKVTDTFCNCTEDRREFVRLKRVCTPVAAHRRWFPKGVINTVSWLSPAAYAENLRGGAKFRHNRVTSQINFRRSAEDTTILGWSRDMPPGKFCKITPKNTHFYAFWKQVLV